MTKSLATQLFDDAGDAGDLSLASVALLSPLGKQIGRALSTVDPIRSDRVTLVTLLLDNSPSMEHVNPDRGANPGGVSNAEVVREGHDLVWQALSGAKTADSIQAFTALINPFKGNEGVHFNFRPLAGWETLTRDRYYLCGVTPLRDAILRTLGAVAAETQKYLAQAIEVASVTLIMTDGADNDSRASNDDVRKVVGDLLAQERHQIFLAGVDLGGFVDYHAVGKELGLRAECIREVPSDPKEIRNFLKLFSQSAIAVSQAADPGTISKIGLGA